MPKLRPPWSLHDKYQAFAVHGRALEYIPVLDVDYIEDDVEQEEWLAENNHHEDVPNPQFVEYANLICSLIPATGKHKPVLDIDFPIRAVESKTEGHYHLYLDGIELEWEQYVELLQVLAKVGIIEQGYCNAAIERGMTRVRTPQGVGKGPANE